jgi:hypothetical protein
MIYVGIDDTDTIDTRGTNQLARALAARVADEWRCRLIVRHQLLHDSRVPYTSHNGSASLLFEPVGAADVGKLTRELRAGMQADFIPGSDPGLCVAEDVPATVSAFGRRCQCALVRQSEARDLAQWCGMHLEGLGGTEDGVIGALAAVGLVAEGNDGRVVHLGPFVEELSGEQDVAAILARGVEVRTLGAGRAVSRGRIDLGKKLRPNRRDGRTVLFVEACNGGHSETWRAVRLT